MLSVHFLLAIYNIDETGSLLFFRALNPLLRDAARDASGPLRNACDSALKSFFHAFQFFYSYSSPWYLYDGSGTVAAGVSLQCPSAPPFSSTSAGIYVPTPPPLHHILLFTAYGVSLLK